MQLNSIRGYLFVGIGDQESIGYSEWKWRKFPANSLTDSGATGTVAWGFTRKVGALGFGVVESNQMRFVYMPYWFFAVLAVALAVFSWSNQTWRFSLRTLIITMTVVAVVLGLIVYFSAKPPATPPLDHFDVPEF
jgi:hypothetical protein